MAKISLENENQIIFPGFVDDVNDPMMLGRIRAIPEKYVDVESVKKANNFNEETDKWKDNDPFIFLPLLPYYTYIVPQKDEYVHIIFQNKKFKYQNQFYIPGKFSSPMSLKFEHYEGAKKFLAAGDLLPNSLALKNAFGNYFNLSSKGVFPEPTDNAFMGKGTTDLILKPDEVLLRAGKTNVLDKNQFPQANNLRAFLQLSNFTQRVVDLEPTTTTFQENIYQSVKKLVQWNIDNLNNTENVFTGWVKLYDVIQSNDFPLNTKNFSAETITKITDGTNLNFTGIQESFFGKSFEEVLITINNFIKGVFLGSVKNISINEQFPFVVSPSKLTYEKGNKFESASVDDVTELTNYIRIYSKIKLNLNKIDSGFFIVSNNNNGIATIGPISETKTITTTAQDIISSPITYGVMGAQKLYFMSHNSIGPKGKIDIENTLYGISQELFTKPDRNIENQTYPTVRGDELISLLRKMMAFITGHVHPISTIPPVPVAAGNGQTSSEIEFLLANAENTILNQNIRIN